MSKPREFWIENRKEVLASNRLLFAYDEENKRIGKEHDPEFDKRDLIHVIEYSAYEALQAKLGIAVEALEYVELCDAYPDLSSFKYQDAYRIIRPKVKDALVKIRGEEAP